jgi:Tfp pilus assembly protein PilZ
LVILNLRIKSIDEWRELAPVLDGPIFVPTTDEVEAGQQVIIEVSSQLLPNKVLVRGTVQSWRPALPRMRVRAGATIEPSNEEQVKLAFLDDVLAGKRTDVQRRKHHRLPVSVGVRYRVAASPGFIDGELTEIGVGGALLATKEALPLESDLTLEIVPPGGAAALGIAGKVSYHTPSGGTGVRFLTRDADGDRRLRELIRRLRAS